MQEHCRAFRRADSFAKTPAFFDALLSSAFERSLISLLKLFDKIKVYYKHRCFCTAWEVELESSTYSDLQPMF